MGKNGGVRPGAGRKSNAAKLLAAKWQVKCFDQKRQETLWNQLLNSEDERIVLDTVKELTNRIYGKPKEQVEHTGKVTLESLISGSYGRD